MTSSARVAQHALGLALAVSLFLVMGCARQTARPTSPPDTSVPPSEQPSVQALQLEGTDWACTAVAGGDGALVGVIDGTTVTARFDDGTVRGSTGVNTYQGAYTLEGSALLMDPAFQVTERGGEPAAMDQESAFLAAIGKAAAYGIDDGVLTLSDAAGEQLATFEPAQ